MQAKVITRLATVMASSFLLATASAQTCPTVLIAPANRIPATSAGYTFSGPGKKVGIINSGSGTLTVSGNINFQANDTLYVGANVVLSSYINGFTTGCMIINCGNSDLGSFSTQGGQIDNYNTLTTSYFSFTNTVVNNYANFVNTGGGTVGSNSTLNNNSVFTLPNYLSVYGVFNNFGTARLDQVDIYGAFKNKNFLVSKGSQFAIANGGVFFNSCRMVVQQFINNTAAAENYGMLWVTSNGWGAFQNKSTMINAGYLRTGTFQNSGTLTNNASNINTSNQLRKGYIRIEGGSGSDESVNSGVMDGGYVSDAYNHYNMDNPGTANTTTVAAINAYDTSNYQTASFLMLNCSTGNSGGTGATPLPIKLISFTGSANNSYNILNWTVGDVTEMNSMELQYAADGSNYETIDYTSLVNQNINNRSYSYNDDHAGNAYYRLRFTDLHGAVTYSSVVRLAGKAADGTATISYAPNPFNDNIDLNINLATAQNIRVQVYDLSGKTIKISQTTGNAGSNNIRMDGLSNLIPGIYLLQVYTDAQAFQYKIVKQ